MVCLKWSDSQRFFVHICVFQVESMSLMMSSVTQTGYFFPTRELEDKLLFYLQGCSVKMDVSILERPRSAAKIKARRRHGVKSFRREWWTLWTERAVLRLSTINRSADASQTVVGEHFRRFLLWSAELTNPSVVNVFLLLLLFSTSSFHECLFIQSMKAFILLIFCEKAANSFILLTSDIP